MNYVRSFERPGTIRRKPLVWLLLGGRAGDNNQLLALADALGFPYEVKELRYSLARRFPLLRRGMNGLAPESRTTVAPPWPDLVMAVGYASVPVANSFASRRAVVRNWSMSAIREGGCPISTSS